MKTSQSNHAKRITVQDSPGNALAKSRARTPMRIQPNQNKSKVKIDKSKIVIKDAEVVSAAKSANQSTTNQSATSRSANPSKSASAQSSSAKSTPKTNSKKHQRTMKLPLIRKLHFKVRYVVLAVIVLLLSAFIARVAIWEHNYLLAMEGSERHVAESDASEVTASEDEASTVKPTDNEIKEYTVAADKPRYFSIPILGIRNARIIEIGVNASGELGTPYSIYDVGWYNGSTLPGGLGVSVMDGHGGYLGGIFKSLPNIAVGDEISIEMGDGRIFYYRVTGKVTKELGADANAYMKTAMTPTPGKGTLTLITCTGIYSQVSKTFSERLFVQAVFVRQYIP